MAEKRKKSLLKTFARAVAGLTLGCALAYGGFVGVFYAGRGDKLTEGESNLVTSIFGDEVDASKIRKHFKDDNHITHLFGSKTGTVLPFLNHIDIFGPYGRSPDYAREGEVLYGLFVHESTHVWQNQNWAWTTKAMRVYEYELKPESKFSDFGGEQQASIIENYAQRFLHPQGRKDATAETAAFDAMLQKVVEERFPRAKETRMALDAADAVKPAMKVAEGFRP
ncbi:MAG: hypothetical protein EPN97_12810 [Alphaproteobacteria bacterium]|nr:MAG: hypothetical protein EPN97_12810 [Alphaproteobacteria bacterium]